MFHTNPARLLNYMFIIGSDKNDPLSYSCPAGVIGGIDLGVTRLGYKSHDITYPSDKIEYDDIIVPFYLSDDLHEWTTIVKWMFYCRKNSSVADASITDKSRKECTMFITDGQDDLKAKIIYHNCFPYNIDSINYTTNTSDNNEMVFNVGFKYTHFSIETEKEGYFNEFS